MNKKHGSDILLSFAERLSGWTGAEIEQLAKDSLFEGPPDPVESACNSIIPLSRTMREEIQSLRDWARTRARFANTPEDEPEQNRKLRPGPKAKAGGSTNSILN